MQESLRLFNAVIVDSTLSTKFKSTSYLDYCQSTLQHSYIVDEEVYNDLTSDELAELAKYIKANTLTHEQWNNAFYKSWDTIESLSDEQRLIDQMLHYLTTYGPFKDEAFVYIPEGEIEGNSTGSILYIKALDKTEAVDKVKAMLESGIALKESTQMDLLALYEELEIGGDYIHSVKNKEFKSKLYTLFDVVPNTPEEFLRYMLLELFNIPMIVKNEETLNIIKAGGLNSRVKTFFEKYEGKVPLASIFYRYKPVWLAFRSHRGMKPLINEMRRQAVKAHRPMREDLLNTLTDKIRKGIVIDEKELDEALAKVNNFRKIRLMYAMKQLRAESTAHVYRIRNGKSWAKRSENTSFSKTEYVKVAQKLYDSLISNMNVEGKTFSIPKGMNIALPATEKQFIGNLPCGTFFETDKNLLFGVHWENSDEYGRIDLDLAMIDVTGKFGWDGSYGNNHIGFTGDMTDAPKPAGASEFFRFKTDQDGAYLVTLNFYNGNGSEKVPFDILAGTIPRNTFPLEGIVNLKKTLVKTEGTYGDGKSQKTLGLVKVKDGKVKIYFNEFTAGGARSSSENEVAQIQREYLSNSLDLFIDFRKVLLDAGATEVENEADLEFGQIDKSSILELFYKG